MPEHWYNIYCGLTSKCTCGAATSVDIPEPTDGHARMQHEDNMVPLWVEGSYLPEILMYMYIDNLMTVDEDSDEDTDESSAVLDS